MASNERQANRRGVSIAGHEHFNSPFIRLTKTKRRAEFLTTFWFARGTVPVRLKRPARCIHRPSTGLTKTIASAVSQVNADGLWWPLERVGQREEAGGRANATGFSCEGRRRARGVGERVVREGMA